MTVMPSIFLRIVFLIFVSISKQLMRVQEAQ